MSDRSARSIDWIQLLEETRVALGSLRSDDLDRLSRRAEEMFAADIEATQRPEVQRIRGGGEASALSKGHRLLGDLLLETDRNCAVLWRTLGASQNPRRAGEETPRWVR